MGQYLVSYATRIHDDEGKQFNGVPNQVDKDVRENLRIFEEEEVVRSPLIISLDGRDSLANYDFHVDRNFRDLSMEKNYELIPQNVTTNIFLFLSPYDLTSVFSTCRYFQRVGRSNHFWRRYYEEFYQLLPSERSGLENGLNFKKQFFKRFSDCRNADKWYRKRHIPIFVSEDELEQSNVLENVFSIFNERMNRLGEGSEDSRPHLLWCNNYVICGPVGCGKRSLLHRLWKNEFNEDQDLELEPYILMNSFRPSFREEQLFRDPRRFFEELRIISDINDEGCRPEKSFIFCFTAGNRRSFEEVKKFVRKYSTVLQASTPSKQRMRGILVGTKTDQRVRDEVGMKEIRKLLDRYTLKAYVECSAKENTSCYLPFGVLVEKRTWRFKRPTL